MELTKVVSLCENSRKIYCVLIHLKSPCNYDNFDILQALKTIFVAVMLMGVVPLLLGLLFELVVVAPLRVALDQTPVFFPWQV